MQVNLLRKLWSRSTALIVALEALMDGRWLSNSILRLLLGSMDMVCPKECAAGGSAVQVAFDNEIRMGFMWMAYLAYKL